MADQVHHYETSRSSSGMGAIIFIVGGLVVAVGIIGWLMSGGEIPTTGDGGSINIDVDAPIVAPVEGGEATGGSESTGGGEAAGN